MFKIFIAIVKHDTTYVIFNTGKTHLICRLTDFFGLYFILFFYF